MRVDDEVLAVLSQAETNGFELKLTGQIDRKLYNKTNKVLEAAGGKWCRKAKAHVFAYEAADRIDEIILSGEVDVPKDEFNYFPSPHAVVARLIELADLHEGMTTLEPSAGRGAIAFACVEATGGDVDCYELMEENFWELEKTEQFRKVINSDFLVVKPFPEYDRICMNPPFARQQDIKHVTHALKFLKPDGKLVSVMSASVGFRENRLTNEFRDLITERGGSIESLPDGAFKNSGTMVRTVIVTIPGMQEIIKRGEL